MPKHLNKFLALFASISSLACNFAQNKNNPKDSNNAITVRNAHSMVYHTAEDKVYLFGGANEKEVLSDLYVLKDTVWEKVETEASPAPRTFASMAYHHNDRRIVLFGGSKVLFGKGADAQNLLNDTWVFESGQWKKMNTTDAPSPRAEAVMVYDEARERLVLFGGYTIEGKAYKKLGDTWEFYQNNWVLVSEAGPSARHGVAMAFDPEIKKVVLFGGSTVDKQYGEQTGETWIWDGGNWKKLAIEQPFGVFNACMAYDSEKKRIIRFGGWNGKERINSTWILQNDSWQILEPEKRPSPRNHSGMVYTKKDKAFILFGGHDGSSVFGDTWQLKDGNWKLQRSHQPLKRIRNGH